MEFQPDHHGDFPDRFSEEVIIEAPVSQVWEHLASPRSMSQWLGGSDYAVEVDTTWEVGSAIVIRGVHHLPFENKGVVLVFRPCAALSYTHLSSLSRLPDQPSSYATLSFVLEGAGEQTILKLEVSEMPTAVIYKHLHFYWMGTLDAFKSYVEMTSQPRP